MVNQNQLMLLRKEGPLEKGTNFCLHFCCCFSALKDLNLGNNKFRELPKGKSGNNSEALCMRMHAVHAHVSQT